ncbi:MAG TPA: hypothetical protein VJM33_16320 [Microthrixaceae bacterium]|nr:hypothetical protein [Microthrixaceae bacterium]
MLVHAWLEEREIRGLHRAFRGRLTCPERNETVGFLSPGELHHELDRILRDAGLLDTGDD